MEVSALMSLLKRFLAAEEPVMLKNGIRLSVIGQIDRLPEDVKSALKRVMSSTAGNTGMLLNLVWPAS